LAHSFHKAHPSWTPQSIADDFDQRFCNQLKRNNIIPQIVKVFEKILHITSEAQRSEKSHESTIFKFETLLLTSFK
jgi:hypothetical protein